MKRKNMKLWDWVVWNQRLDEKISMWLITYETYDFIWSKQKTLIRKFYFFLCVYINDWYYQKNTWKQQHRSNSGWC